MTAALHIGARQNRPIRFDDKLNFKSMNFVRVYRGNIEWGSFYFEVQIVVAKDDFKTTYLSDIMKKIHFGLVGPCLD